MTNNLMFEIGVSESVKNLDKVKKLLDDFVKDYTSGSKALKLRVEIDNLDTITRELSKIGDTQALRNLREEIAAINREFLQLSKGAGGVGDIASRGVAQEIERQMQNIERYNAEIKRLNEERSKLVGGKLNRDYSAKTDEIDRYKLALEGATEKLQKLQQQSSQPIVTANASAANTLNLEGTAAQEAMEKLNKLVLEKQEVVNAEKKLSESNQQSTKTLTEESKSAEKVADALEKTKKSASEQEGLTGKQIQQYAILDARIEKIISSLSKLRESSQGKYYGSQLDEAIKSYQNVLSGSKLGRAFEYGSEHITTLNRNLTLLGQQYANVIKGAKDLNTTNERNSKEEQRRAEKTIALQQKIDEMRQKTFSNLGIRENDPGMRNMQTALDNIMNRLAKVRSDIDLYHQAICSGSKESIDFGQKGLKDAEKEAEILMRQYAALYEAMERLRAGGNERPLLSTEQQNKELEMLNETFRKGTSELQKKAKAEDEAAKIVKKANDESEKAAKRAADAQARSQERIQNAAKRTSENLGTLIDRLDAKKLSFKGMDFTELDTAISKIRAIKIELENLARTGSSVYGNSAKEIVHNMGLAGANEEARIAISNLTTGKREAEKASKELSDSEQRLANSIKSTSDSMRGQSQILSDLRSMAMQYLSVWGAQSFVNSIIETGGQLEQQRLSLSAILGDMEKASTLFGQIKTLALKSPFGVVELDKMSKQLAAYSFDYDELFDWTKRLADISAATGTSVDRLALALGHVRSEGALSGYTLRQFAMANVPVLRMLSENLGISSKEVRERVKKKEIGADDVQDILRQLTDDGGMFANAQETMSEALNAKFKNLRDAFDIMYGEIAEGGVGNSLKELAVLLTQGAKHWERLGKDVLMVAVSFGVGKVAIMAYNAALGNGTAALLKSTFAAKEREVVNLKLTRSYRALTAEEETELAMQRKWWSFGSKLNTNNIKVLLSTKKLTVAQLERAVAMGKVSKADAIAAMNLLKLNTTQMQSVKVFGLWGRIWQTFAYGARMAGLAVKSFIASVAPLLALTAVFELWFRRSEQKDAAKNMASSMAGNARGKEAYELRGSLADSNKLSKEALESNTEEMIKALEAAGAYTDELKKQVDQIDDSAEKYDLLKDKIGEVADKYEDLKTSQEKMLNDAWDAGGGFLSDNMAKDAEQYDEAFAKYEKVLTVGSKQMKETLKKWMEIQGLWKDEFSKMTGKQLFEQLSEQDANRFLAGGDKSIYRSRGYDEATRDALAKIAEARNKVGDKLAEMKGEQGEEFAHLMKSMYEEAFGVDLDKATQEQVNDFDKWLRETIGRAENLSKQAKEALRGIVIDFTVTLKPNYVVDQPQTPKEVVESQIGDNKWLSGFFGRQNGGSTPITWTVDQAQKEVKKYKKLFGDISLSNLDTAPKKLNSLLDGLEETKKNLQSTLSNGLLSQDERDDIQKSLKETTDFIDLANKALKDVGGKRQRKGDKGKENKFDTERAKAVREEIRIMKEAADAFQYWREKVGDGAAWAHVEAEFGDVLARIGITAKNVNDLRSNIDGLTPKIQKIKDKKVQNETFKEQKKELAQLDRKDFEKTADEFASKVQIELDGLTRAWAMFNSVREATGNIELAVQISGANYENGKTRNLADALKEKIQKDFDAAGGDIAFDMNLSDKAIEESIQSAMPSASQKQIKGLVDEYKKWRDLQRDVLKQDIDVFTKIVGGAKDYDSQIQKINDDLQNQITALDEVAKKNPEKKQEVEKAKGAATAQANYETWKLSTQYINLMNNSLSMTRDEVENGINIGMQRLNDLMMNNRISAQEYAQEMEKIRNIQSEWNKNSFFGTNTAWGAGIMGGLSGRKNYYQSQVRSAEMERMGLLDLWQKRGLTRSEYDRLDKANKTITNGNKNIDDINKFEGLTSSFDALAKAMDPVINLFNELGMTGIGNVLSAGQNALQSAASTGLGAAVLFRQAAAGPYGAAIGAGLSLVSSLFGGFDDALQKEIEASKQRQKEMEYLSDNLDTALDRALGGVYRVSDTAQGQQVIGDFNEKAKEYYEKYDKYQQALSELKGGSISPWVIRNLSYGYIQNGTIDEIRKAQQTGKYYDMQRASLKIQQDELRHQIESEKDKKETDWSAVSDMEQQIKELDDQWRNFAKDMMKALYEIDVKDWASQFGDALYDAWKKGEDGAQAFKKKASEIIGNIAKNILVQRVIGSALEPVENAIIKMMDDTSGELSEKDFTEQIGTLMANSVGKIVPTLNAALDAVDLGLQKSGLPSLKENADSSMSGSIKSITENTADILASYLNAIRADVSVNRMELINIRENYLKDIKTQMVSASASLQNIENHTDAIMRSNATIAEKITNLDNNITSLKHGVWSVPTA